MESVLSDIVGELKNFDFVKAVYVFGSYAADKQTPVSDIDICVIDDPGFSRDERRKVYRFATDKLDVSLFSDLPLYMQYEVFKGRSLYMRDEKYVRELREKTTFEYLDKRWLWDDYLKDRKGKWSIPIK